MDWNEEHINILKEWKAKCFVNLWLQDRSAYYYWGMHNWLSYPVIVISSISSAALFSTDNEIVKYFSASMALSAGILTAITRQMKPGELHQQYLITSRRYQNIIRTIDTCLSLAADLRAQPATFIEKTGLELDSLSSTELGPPISVRKQFEIKYGPLDKILYGEDIVEVVRLDIEANNRVREVRKTQKNLSELTSNV